MYVQGDGVMISFNKFLLKSILITCMLIFSSVIYSQSYFKIYQRGRGYREVNNSVSGESTKEKIIFNLLGKLCSDSEKNLFVLDINEHHILKFDDKFNLIKVIGKRGQGPGELNFPSCISTTINDNILVYDSGNRRLSLFDNEGQIIKTINVIYLFDKLESIIDFKTDKQGHIYIQTMIVKMQNINMGTILRIYQFDSDFGNKELIIEKKIYDRKIVMQGNTGRNIPQPYHSKIYWDVNPSDEIIIGNSEDYTLKYYSSDLKLMKTIKHQAKRQIVTDNDKTKFYNSIFRTSKGQQPNKNSRDLQKDKTIFPKYKPFFRGLKIDHEGYILILTYNEADTCAIYDIFTPEGRFINQVELPLIHPYAIFSDNWIYETRNTSNKFSQIIRYRLK